MLVFVLLERAALAIASKPTGAGMPLSHDVITTSTCRDCSRIRDVENLGLVA